MDINRQRNRDNLRSATCYRSQIWNNTIETIRSGNRQRKLEEKWNRGISNILENIEIKWKRSLIRKNNKQNIKKKDCQFQTSKEKKNQEDNPKSVNRKQFDILSRLNTYKIIQEEGVGERSRVHKGKLYRLTKLNSRQQLRLTFLEAAREGRN